MTGRKLFTGVAVTALILAACGGGAVTDSTASPTNVEEPPTTQVGITTTMLQTPTTATVITTTTLLPAAVQPLEFSYQSAEGWEYQIDVFYTGTDPNSSPGGCIDVAPPGQTHLTFLLVIRNLINDREAPIAEIVAGANIIDDGDVLVGEDPFGDAVRDARRPGKVRAEILPNAPEKRCIFAMTLGDDVGTISADGTSEHFMHVGPVDQELVQETTVALRLFPDIGMFYQAEFGVSDGSGSVSELRSIFEDE